jgi:F5/8 type C domain/Divergent InlB B-repeat domain
VRGGGIDCPGNCSRDYRHGTQVSLTAAPAEDQTFLGWGGACTGAGTTCQVNTNGDESVTASFGTSTDAVKPDMPTISALSSTWLTVSSPYSFDANRNSYSTYAHGPGPNGPWTPACSNGIAGASEWRHCTIGRLVPNASYYVRVTFADPDGVVAVTNPVVVGPVRTAPSGTNATTIGETSVTVRDTHLLVSVPVGEDADMNSTLDRVEVSTSPDGPWTLKCGPVTGSFSPKLCRIHGLEQGQVLYVRVSVKDLDGTRGPTPELIGPVVYKGLTNLALGQRVVADSGWGCCLNPMALTDGRIMESAWRFGFSWAGGLGHWAGIAPGWKQATIDLGTPQTVARVDFWPHNASAVPTSWAVEVSTDGITFTQVFQTAEPRCRTATQSLANDWAFPSCGHSARFGPVRARYVRYHFDDALLDRYHGWGKELEVFGPAPSAAGSSRAASAKQ